MGILDRVAGTPEDRFAKRVLATVRSAGIAEAWYDRDTFTISYRRAPGAQPDGTIYLHNVYQECQAAGREEQDRRIAALVSSVVHAPAMPDAWASARPLLRPVLRAASFAAGLPPGAHVPLRRPALPFLNELVVIDTPTSMAYVTTQQLAEWGVNEAAVFDAAHGNLVAVSAVPPAAPGSAQSIIRMVDTGDAYFTSRLLLPGWLPRLGPHVGGRPVAFVPDINTVIVLADGSGAFGKVLELAEQEYRGAARPISPYPYTVDDRGAVVPYPLVPGHPDTVPLSRAAAILAGDAYDGQADWLTAQHERDGIDVYVDRLLVVGRPDGTVFTVASWTRDVDTLLPEAQYVGINAPGEAPFFVPWATIEREVDLVPVPDLDPVRYRLSEWPPDGVVHRLRAAAVVP